MTITLLSFSALTVWWLSVYNGYRRGIPVYTSSRTLIALGITILYILPSIYFNIYSHLFPHKIMYYKYYPHALIMINLAGLGFLLTTFLYIRKYNNLNRNMVLSFNRRQKLIIIFAFFMLLGIFSVISDFRTGSFYFYIRSNYQFENYHLFVLSRVGRELLLAAVYFFYALGYIYNKRKYQIISISIWLILFTIAFITVSKSTALKMIVQFVVLYILLGWKPKMRHIVLLFAVGVLVTGSMISYNSAMRKHVSSPHKLMSPLITAKIYLQTFSDGEQGLDSKGKELSFLAVTMSRFNAIRDVAAIYAAVPEIIPYQNGYTYRHFLFFLIPRPIWKNKPDMREGADFMAIAIPDRAGSTPLTWVAEAYLNFSWPGTFMIGVLLAIFCLWIDYRLLPKFYSNHPLWIALWTVYSFKFIWISKTFPVLVTDFLKLLIIFMIVDALSRATFITKYDTFERSLKDT